MRALLRKPLGSQPWAVLGILMLCLFIGAAIPLFSDAMGGRAGGMMALPALLLLLVLLIYDYRMLFMLIILMRSVGDMALESTQFSVGPVHMGVGGLINLVVIMIACMMVLKKPQDFPSRLARYWIPVLVMMGIAAAISYEKAEAIKVYLGMLSYFAIFIIAVYTVRSVEDFNKAIRLVLWSSVIPTLYSFVDVALHMRGGGFRLQSTFSHPNVQAFYVTLMLTLCLYVLKSPLFKIKPLGRVVICCYTPLLLAQLVLTETRSAWLACLLIFMLYALLFERKYLLYLLALPLVVLCIPSVSDRLMDLDQGNEVVRYAKLNSFAWRVALWQSAIGWMEPVRLIYGYGLGGFSYFAQTFFVMAGTTSWDAHNVYVQFLFDMGLIGLSCYLWLYARILGVILAFRRIDRISAFLVLAIIVQYLIVSFSDNMFRYLVFNWYFWFIVGGACALVELHARVASSTAPKHLRDSRRHAPS